MTSTTLLPLHFAAHLFTLTIAMAAAFVAARRTEGTRPARIAGATGFLTLAAAEALHGAAVVGEASDLAGALRAGGYVLILGSALLVRRPAFAGLAFVGAPIQSVVPAAAAMAAGIAYGWRSPRDRGQLAIAAGLVMIGAGESFFAIPESGFPGAEFMSHLGRALGWGLVAAGVMSATRRSIRFRYVASFVAVLLVVILAVSSAITQVIGNNLRRETAARVSDEARALADRFEPEAVTAAQTAQGSAAAVAPALGDPEAVLRLSRILRRILQLDFVVAVDGSGEVITALGLRSDAETFELAGSDVVAQADATQTVSASVDGLGERQLVVVGAAPFPPPLQGVMVVGFRLDNGLLGQLGPGTDALIVRNRAVSASSLEGVDASTPLPADLVQRIEEVAIERGEQFGAPATINGVEYFVDVRPLLRTDGLVVGALVGTEPTEILAATEQGVYRVLFLVTLGAVAVAILLSLVFGRRFTHPIRQLTIAARQVQAGDLTTKAPVSGEDEVGDLAVAFNRMTESLSSTTESLREAVEEEARLRDQLETVLDSMGDGLVAVDVSGRVVTLNPAAERIGGLVRSKSIGRPLTDVLVGRTAQGAALGGKGIPSGFAFLRRRGEEVPVAISSAPIKGGSGEALGRVFLIRDRSQEAEVDRVKREFLATVSHELRTPLTPIVGYAELLTRRDFDAERVADFARGILSSARRMERIVGMLLDYSAIEAGRMPVEPESVVLRPLVVRSVDEWRDRAPGHRFVTRFGPGAPRAMVDVPLFRRTMDELLDNAVKYSPDGGTITVSVRRNGAGNGKSGVQLEISDQGIGIPPKQLPDLFQDFRQLDGSDTRTFGGLGLGLAFVKRIVQAHRGTISAESRPGKGTTFKIGLPAADVGRRGK
jgi:PAS domain S-box-containing protein